MHGGKSKGTVADGFTPGPGQYYIESSDKVKKATRGYTFGGRYTYNLSNKFTTPRPGNYNILYESRNKGTLFGSSKRPNITKTISNKSPGPGTYDILSKVIAYGPKYKYFN